MSEYIVDVGDADEKHLEMFHIQADALFGHPVKEEIVRCRDCKWFTPEYFYEEERGFGVKEILSEPPSCGNPERCSATYDNLTQKMVPVHIVTVPNGFCAWGERRES